jgi:hypothetical protein
MKKPTELTTRLSLGASEDLLAVIDEWRRRQPSLPSRAKAARLMIEATAARDGVVVDPTPPVRPAKKAPTK